VRQTFHRGISLRPSDAINPYRLGKLAPDRLGVHYLTVWCKFCDSSLLVTELTLVPGQGLLIEGVCHTCSNKAGTGVGIYRRFLVALAEGALPSVT
jgi:hypothetical protein